jgi:hypothetical protein
MVVNVWGNKDLLAIRNLIGGYREGMGGFSVTNDEKPLFNIEIDGADHFDYIRGVLDYTNGYPATTTQLEAEERNKIVSKYVAELTLHATNPMAFKEYLDFLEGEHLLVKIGKNHWKLSVL